LLDAGNFPHLTDEELARSVLTDILVPLLVAAPILFLLLSRLRTLTIAHDRTLEHTATDELTGLMTRRAFIEEVEEELADARFAEDGVRGTLLIVDVDELKAINDRFGHEHGDSALQVIARSMKGVLRAADRIGRIGGDEFAVFLPATSPLVADAVAERIRLAITKVQFIPDETPITLSVSVGGATYDRWLPYAELFRLAEQQLYAAKHNGRNRVSVSSIGQYDPLPAIAA
jgi:diguanylate cyclase